MRDRLHSTAFASDLHDTEQMTPVVGNFSPCEICSQGKWEDVRMDSTTKGGN